MTRNTRRGIANAVDDLADDGDDGAGISVVFDDGRGDYYADEDMTEPIENPDDLPGLIIVLGRAVVMRRERAEQEGREILGPAENTPDGVDVVRVALEE